MKKLNMLAGVVFTVALTASAAMASGDAAATPELTAAPAVQQEAAVEGLNINTATAEEMTQALGLPPAIAEKISSYRTAHGEFKSLTDLLKVEGVGEEVLLEIKRNIVL